MEAAIGRRRFYLRVMRAKRASRFIRENPLFPFIPFGPIALFLGSVVMSAMALRGVRQIRRELMAGAVSEGGAPQVAGFTRTSRHGAAHRSASSRRSVSCASKECAQPTAAFLLFGRRAATPLRGAPRTAVRAWEKDRGNRRALFRGSRS